MSNHAAKTSQQDQLATLSERIEDLSEWIERATYAPNPEQWAAEARADFADDVCMDEAEAEARTDQIRKEAQEAVQRAMSAPEAYAKCRDELLALDRELTSLTGTDAGHREELQQLREILNKHLNAAGTNEDNRDY